MFFVGVGKNLVELVAEAEESAKASFGGLELGKAVEGLDDYAFGFVEGRLFFEVVFGGLDEVKEEALVLEFVMEDNLEDEGDVVDIGAERRREIVKHGVQMLEYIGVLLGKKVSISGAVMAG